MIPPRLGQLVVLALTLSLSFAVRSAHAEVSRYALVIGNNSGAPHEARLRYAERDAEKLRDTLQLLGGFRAENTVLLLGKGASEVQRVLISLNARIRAESSQPRDSMLVVYYSGHADAQNLHLGQENLELSLLKRLVQGSAAAFRVLLLDACRSGALTRVKGGHPTSAFEVGLDEQLSGEGIAFLTSSASDEDAQESDTLQGSFFTHYLVSGLRGAADKNQNGSVSVEEAYDFAYQHTLDASSRTQYGLQHPTFAFDLKGKGGIPLTWIGRGVAGSGAAAPAVLTIPRARDYLIFAGDASGPVIAEVGALDLRRDIALAAGRYFVRGRAEDYLLEGQVELAPGQGLVVPEDALERVQYARLARKGYAESEPAHGPWIAGRVRTGLWSEASLCPGVRAGYTWDLPSFSLSTGLGACRSRFHNSALSAHADEFEGSAEGRYVLDLSRLSLGVGVTLGASWLRQSFETEGAAPNRSSVAGRIGPVVSVSSEVAYGMYWQLAVSGELYLFRQQQASAVARNAKVSLGAVPAAATTLAFGKYF